MPAVGFKTVKGPKWGDCGAFDWIFRWFVTNANGPVPKPLEQNDESWIIQHVKNKYKRVECGENCDGKVVWDLTEDYYKAWRVGKKGYPLHKYKYDFKGDGSPIEVDYSHIADDDGDDNWSQEGARRLAESGRRTRSYTPSRRSRRVSCCLIIQTFRPPNKLRQA